MATHAEFNNTTAATEVAATFGSQIKGRTVVITGISPEGIGAATALAVASQEPANLILASRTESKLATVVSDISEKYPAVPIKSIILDLASSDSIKSAAAEINSVADHIDVLINNAGLTLKSRQPVKTPGGTTVDLQFSINHLGTFLFTSLLLPKVIAAGANAPKGSTRVVNVGSHAHRLSPIRFSDYALYRAPYDVPEAERPPTGVSDAMIRSIDGYPGFIGYGQSKTANILHAMELKRRLEKAGANAIAVAVHPGTIDTGLSRDLDEGGRKAIEGTAVNGVFKTLDQGAATTIVGAFDPKLAEVEVEGPLYLADCQYRTVLGAHAADPVAAERLWAETEKMLEITCL
ncbi:related to short-chain dehydrogenase [Cephalotrichum gorgonifer]|uniref:Related to short-chain dehydrogenase n=1 Tax=Cephalotrichum gorgonifer TaxID=2041049 RepID=A0AAE8SYZ1_9PEZI|nr:related to short-chain dehydrogenase [Cephalotrichum gorgonifer]